MVKIKKRIDKDRLLVVFKECARNVGPIFDTIYNIENPIYGQMSKRLNKSKSKIHAVVINMKSELAS